MKLLFDTVPIISFFLTYKLVNIYVATYVTIGVTIFQIFFLLIRKKKIDQTHWITSSTLIILGGATLWLHNEIFIKYKPTVIYLLLAVLLTSAEIKGRKPFQSVIGSKIKIPESFYRILSFSWSIFFIFLSLLNAFVAYYFSTNLWISYKLFGSLGLTFLFILIQGVVIAKKTS